MKCDIVRAWKDHTYRDQLNEEQLSQLPANPAGDLELSEADLASVYGGDGWEPGGAHAHCGHGRHGAFDAQRNSNICSIICSHTCNVTLLDILDLGLV